MSRHVLFKEGAAGELFPARPYSHSLDTQGIEIEECPLSFNPWMSYLQVSITYF